MPDATAASSVDRIPCSTAMDSGNSRGSGYRSTTVFRSGMSAPRAGGGNERRARITHRHMPAETCTYRETHVKPPLTFPRSTIVSPMEILPYGSTIVSPMETLPYVPPLGSPDVIGPRSNWRRFFGGVSVAVRQRLGGSRHERLGGDCDDFSSGPRARRARARLSTLRLDMCSPRWLSGLCGRGGLRAVRVRVTRRR